MEPGYPDWLREVVSLKCVLSVVGEIEVPEIGRLIVASVELWSDVVVVHYNFSAYDPGAQDDAWKVGVSLRDDAGTSYETFGPSGGVSSTAYVTRLNRIFWPAVPPTATRLVLGTDAAEARIVVPL